MVSRGRAGRASLGCLFGLLLVVAAVYFAWDAGEAYMRYYRFRDAMHQVARFAESTSNRDVVERLRAKADSLGLPAEAQKVRVRRRRNVITIWSEYTESVQLPIGRREIKFAPRVESTF